jgi:hypothetical protein
MTALTDHAKSILRAIADGKQFQDRPTRDSTIWLDCKLSRTLFLVAGGDWDMLRIAPETRTVNGVTFAAPVDYKDGNYAITISSPGFASRNFWFVKESDLAAASAAILDALEGKTK